MFFPVDEDINCNPCATNERTHRKPLRHFYGQSMWFRADYFPQTARANMGPYQVCCELNHEAVIQTRCAHHPRSTGFHDSGFKLEFEISPRQTWNRKST